MVILGNSQVSVYRTIGPTLVNDFLSTTFYLLNAISIDFQEFQNATYKRDDFSFLNTINVI